MSVRSLASRSRPFSRSKTSIDESAKSRLELVHTSVPNLPLYRDFLAHIDRSEARSEMTGIENTAGKRADSTTKTGVKRMVCDDIDY